VVLFDPGLNGVLSLSSVDLPTFTGATVHALCFQARVILDRAKEIGHLPRWEACHLDVAFG